MVDYDFVDLNKKKHPWQYFKPGDNILVVQQPIDLNNESVLKTQLAEVGAGLGFFKILNAKQKTPHRRYVAAASLPTTGLNVNLHSTKTPDWDEWLKTYQNEIGIWIVGFGSDRYCEWEVKHPKGGGVVGSTKSATVINCTDEDHIKLITNFDQYPGFILNNYSQYTLAYAYAEVLYGWTYNVSRIKTEVPKYFDTLVINDTGA